MYDVIVVGGGLIGAAAARHLAEGGARVALIGPDEPADPKQHLGVFASHYDEGRVTRVLDRDPVWAELAQRSMQRYAAIEEASGITFHTARGYLRVDHDEATHAQVASVGSSFGVDADVLRGEEIGRRFPVLRAADDLLGLNELGLAGFINPRRLVAAQKKLGQISGVQLVTDVVVLTREVGDRLQVETRSCGAFDARDVLVTAGAFANCFEVLPHKLALSVRPETVLMVPVEADEMYRFREMPGLWFELRDADVPHCYMVPPVQYPDGRYYLKVGADHDRDVSFSGHEDYCEYFVRGGSTHTGKVLGEIVDSIVPSLANRKGLLKPCILSYSPHGRPMVDRVSDHIFVAVAGCGGAAKSSDEIGRMAALLVEYGAWRHHIDENEFRVVAL